ncbi:hypothetical protein BsWGS_21569 [Bradybaena similaris]
MCYHPGTTGNLLNVQFPRTSDNRDMHQTKKYSRGRSSGRDLLQGIGMALLNVKDFRIVDIAGRKLFRAVCCGRFVVFCRQTAEHVLQLCPLYDHQRRTFWPSVFAFHSKIYGTRMELLLQSNYNRVHHEYSSDIVNIQQVIERRRIRRSRWKMIQSFLIW